MDVSINKNIELFSAFKGWLLILIGVVVFVLVLIEVFKAIKPSENEDARKVAQKHIFYIVAMAGGAYILVELIQYVMNAMK